MVFSVLEMTRPFGPVESAFMTTDKDAVTSAIHFTKDVTGQLRAHVLAKRTYTLPQGRPAEVANQQLAIVREMLYEGEDEETPVAWEPDFFACAREGTDVIIQGHAICRDGPKRELEVSASIEMGKDKRGDTEKYIRRIRVFGDRRVYWYNGSIFFTEPEPFEKMPISYTRAYGGKDRHADIAQPDDYAAWVSKSTDEPIEDYSPYMYPRNSMGRGYVVFPNREALDGLALPNLEMPTNLLSPQNLVLGSAQRWPSAPRPACFNFTHQDWFPRSAYVGIVHEFEGAPETIPEVREGSLPGSLVSGDFFDNLGSPESPGFLHGAPPWLIFPDFDGDEVIRVRNMHPTLAELVVPMPAERPQMLIEPFTGGGPTELQPALRTVVLRPENEELIVVWVGTLVVDRPPTEAQYKKMRHVVRWRK